MFTTKELRNSVMGLTLFCILGIVLASSAADAGPIDIIVNPSPQEFGNTCQSYSMALAVSMTPGSPFVADTATELRDLERRIRQAIVDSTTVNHRPSNQPIRDDWRNGVETATNHVLTAKWQSFADVDSAMRFVGQLTGITTPETLGIAFSAALTKTPALASFDSIESSSYTSSHIVTVLGVQLPAATMGNNATPNLLAVNSAVKYSGGVKNICAEEDLSDADRYRAITSLTHNYVFHKFPGAKPYLITWIERK